MADKAEVAFVTALTEGLCTYEIDIMQFAVVDDVAAAEHRSETLQNVIFGEDVLVQTFQRLKMIAVIGVIGMPHIPPAFAGAVFEPQRNNLPFPLSHHSLFSVISVSILHSTSARTSSSNPSKQTL